MFPPPGGDTIGGGENACFEGENGILRVLESPWSANVCMHLFAEAIEYICGPSGWCGKKQHR